MLMRCEVDYLMPNQFKMRCLGRLFFIVCRSGIVVGFLDAYNKLFVRSQGRIAFSLFHRLRTYILEPLFQGYSRDIQGRKSSISNI